MNPAIRKRRYWPDRMLTLNGRLAGMGEAYEMAMATIINRQSGVVPDAGLREQLAPKRKVKGVAAHRPCWLYPNTPFLYNDPYLRSMVPYWYPCMNPMMPCSGMAYPPGLQQMATDMPFFPGMQVANGMPMQQAGLCPMGRFGRAVGEGYHECDEWGGVETSSPPSKRAKLNLSCAPVNAPSSTSPPSKRAKLNFSCASADASSSSAACSPRANCRIRMLRKKFNLVRGLIYRVSGESSSGNSWLVDDGKGGSQFSVLKNHENVSWEWA